MAAPKAVSEGGVWPLPSHYQTPVPLSHPHGSQGAPLLPCVLLTSLLTSSLGWLLRASLLSPRMRLPSDYHLLPHWVTMGASNNLPSRLLGPQGPQALVLCHHPPSWMLRPCFLLSLPCSQLLLTGPSLTCGGWLSPHPSLVAESKDSAVPGARRTWPVLPECCSGCCSEARVSHWGKSAVGRGEAQTPPAASGSRGHPARSAAAVGQTIPSPRSALPSGSSLSVSPACAEGQVSRTLLCGRKWPRHS